MKRVVSVSLGSSRRDKSTEVTILGEQFEVARVGTNGDMRKFAELVRELDGKVDAIGLGGIDRYLYTDKRRYTVRDADRLARNAKVTPVVDGSGVKNTLERKTVLYLKDQGVYDYSGKNAFVVSGVDRFGMAQTLAGLVGNIVFGDAIYAINVPLPIRSYRGLCLLASALLPIVTRLPFQWLYPTGEKQNVTVPKGEKYYRWADVVAGDFLIIKRTMPTAQSGALAGKLVITNTVTEEDVAALRERGVATLVTSTPEYDGRHFATNVFEGIVVALVGKKPEDITPQDYDHVLEKMDWKPSVLTLNP